MIYFVNKKTIVVRSLILFFMVIVFAFGVTLYANNVGKIDNYKLYYLKSYDKDILFYGSLLANASDEDRHPALSVPVLLYHGIIDGSDGANVNIETFKDQMLALKHNGYTAISLDDFYLFKLGKKKLPEKSVLLTFDDGRKDSYYPVDPILNALGLKATMFIITSTLDNSENHFYLNRKELDAAIASGRWDIQAHTRNGHGLIETDEKGDMGGFFSNKAVLSREPFIIETDAEYEKRIDADLAGAKSDIEKKLKLKSYAFAYPFGDYGQKSANDSKALRTVYEKTKKYYDLAFFQAANTKGFTFNYPGDNMMTKRIYVDPRWSGDDLISILDRSQDKSLPYSVLRFSDKDGWTLSWDGKLDFDEDGMILSAEKGFEGERAYLDGTGSWKNYSFKSEIDWQEGKSVVLMARYVNDENYVSVNINKTHIKLEERIDGVTKELGDMSYVFDGGALQPEIQILNDKVLVKLNGRRILLREFDSQKLGMGGVGFYVWDEKPGLAKIRIKSVDIKKVTNIESPDSSNIASNNNIDSAKTLLREYSLLGGNDGKIAENDNLLKEPIFWESVYGSLLFQDKGVSFSAPAGSAGAMAVLRDFRGRSDYHVDTGFKLQKGSDINIVVRYKDDNNYASVNINGQYLRLVQKVAGKKETIKIVPLKKHNTRRNYYLELYAKGDTVSAVVNGVRIFGRISSKLAAGTFGYEVWCKKDNNAELLVKWMEIE